jgi:hypothetical protein
MDELKVFCKVIVGEATDQLFTPEATTTPPQSE